MINYIWGGMIIASLIVSVFTGNISETVAAATSGAADAVKLCIELLGIMCLWTGLAKIGEKSGIVKIFSRLLRPVTKFLFPSVPDNSPALNAMVMNIVANLLGMGNAATPLGINAVRELQKLNRTDIPSNDMCMFIIINTASIQLLPTTLISLRQTFGSVSPGIIILPVWIVGTSALLVGIASAKFLEKRSRPWN